MELQSDVAELVFTELCGVLGVILKIQLKVYDKIQDML